jgi:hypothetical protein
MTSAEKIAKLEEFTRDLKLWRANQSSRNNGETLRKALNEKIVWVRREVLEAGCFKLLTISPPPAVGGLIMRNVDPFEAMFQRIYGIDVIAVVVDIIDQTIGVLQSRGDEPEERGKSLSDVQYEIIENYAFVAMPIDEGDPELEDVLGAIKEACAQCGIQAERVDEPQSNDRITDRILESVRHAEYVIVDLTHSRPNVYFEAGYAMGIGKIPIYIARKGTKIEFDLKDYPVIFFPNLTGLKSSLEKRLRGLAEKSAKKK